jgi:hypothetical protein
MRALAFVLISVLAAGCAATPAARPAAASPAAAPPAAPEPAAPAESVAGADTSAAAPSSGKDGKAEFIPPSGYRAVKKGNETMYCATIKPIGSNLTKTACYTQAQLEMIEDQMRGVRQDMQQRQSGCTASGGGCGG